MDLANGSRHSSFVPTSLADSASGKPTGGLLSTGFSSQVVAGETSPGVRPQISSVRVGLGGGSRLSSVAPLSLTDSFPGWSIEASTGSTAFSFRPGEDFCVPTSVESKPN